jgi:hypothetical protein
LMSSADFAPDDGGDFANGDDGGKVMVFGGSTDWAKAGSAARQTAPRMIDTRGIEKAENYLPVERVNSTNTEPGLRLHRNNAGRTGRTSPVRCSSGEKIEAWEIFQSMDGTLAGAFHSALLMCVSRSQNARQSRKLPPPPPGKLTPDHMVTTSDLADLRADMATKDDLAAVEKRLDDRSMGPS